MLVAVATWDRPTPVQPDTLASTAEGGEPDGSVQESNVVATTIIGASPKACETPATKNAGQRLLTGSAMEPADTPGETAHGRRDC